MPLNDEGRVSGGRVNRWVKVQKEMYYGLVDFYKDLMMTDGYPPLTEPSSPLEQFQRLSAWRTGGDPRYWQNPAAQNVFATLQRQFTIAAPMPGNG
jgi:hypothetical protein